MRKILRSYEGGDKVVYLDGPRGSGKSTVLQMYADYCQRHFIPYTIYDREDVVLPMSFPSLQDFVDFLSSKTKCDFSSSSYVLLMNEAQYCTSLWDNLTAYAHSDYPMRLLVTGSEYCQRDDIPRFSHYTVYPCDFRECLRYHGYDLDHLPIDRGYKSVYKSVEKYFVDYLIWGGYPAVMMTEGDKEKHQARTTVLHTFLYKDVQHFIRPNQLAAFESVMRALPVHNAQVKNYAHLALISGQSMRFVRSVICFLQERGFIYLHPIHGDQRHQRKSELLTFADIGMFNMMNQAFGSPLFDKQSILTFVWSECMKLDAFVWYTYRKHNGSSIDIIGEGYGIRIAIVVDIKGSRTVPRIIQSTVDDGLRDIAIKTTLHDFFHETYAGKDIYWMPPYLISRWLYERYEKPLHHTDTL